MRDIGVVSVGVLLAARPLAAQGPATPSAFPASDCLRLAQTFQSTMQVAAFNDPALGAADLTAWGRGYAKNCITGSPMPSPAAVDSMWTAQRGEMLSRARLYTWIGRDSLALAILARDPALRDSSADTRGYALVDAISLYAQYPSAADSAGWTAAHARTVAAWLARLDALGDAALGARIMARGRLLERGPATDSARVGYARDVLALAARPGAPSFNQIGIAVAYTTLVRQLWADGRRTEAQAMYDSAARRAGPGPAADAYRRSLMTMIGRDPLVGTRAAALIASAWVNPSDDSSAFPRRGTVTLIEFTSHNCGPCRASYPVLMRLQRQYQSNGFRVVFATETLGFVGDQSDLTPMQEVAADRVYFAEHHHITAPVAVFIPPHPLVFGRPTPEVDVNPNERAYQVTELPQIVLVDEHGIIRDVGRGWDAWTADRVAERVAELVH